MNKIIATGILMLASTLAMATTIHTNITPHDVLAALSNDPMSLKRFGDPSLPPLQHYDVAMILGNPLAGKSQDSLNNIINSNRISAKMNLNLVNYDQSSGEYKFELLLSNVLYFTRTSSVGNSTPLKVRANIYFTNTNKPYLILTGRFIPRPKGLIPKLPTTDKEILLSYVDKDEIDIYPTRDIPITIEIKD